MKRLRAVVEMIMMFSVKIEKKFMFEIHENLFVLNVKIYKKAKFIDLKSRTYVYK